MAITDIILRTVSNADLVTKNAVITWEEEDQNFIEIYEAIKSLQNVDVSLFEPYNAGTVYESGDYVSYSNNIYRFINVTPTSGITPGTDPLFWELASVGEFAHQQNKDQYLDFGGANQVSASDLYDIVTNGIPEISDVAYDATSWNANLDGATKNAIRDKFVTVDAAIASFSNSFIQGGNSFTAPAIFGTNDAQPLSAETQGVTRWTINADGTATYNAATSANSSARKWKSFGSTSGTYSDEWFNSSNSALFWLRNDGATGQLKAWSQVGETVGEASILFTDAAPTILSGLARKLKITASTYGLGAAELTFEGNVVEFNTLVAMFTATEGIVKLPSQTSLNFYGFGATVKGSVTMKSNDLWLYGFNQYGNIGYETADWAKILIETSNGLIFGEPSVGADVGSGARVISIKNAVTEPTTAKADGALLWASGQALKTNAIVWGTLPTGENRLLNGKYITISVSAIQNIGEQTFEYTGIGGHTLTLHTAVGYKNTEITVINNGTGSLTVNGGILTAGSTLKLISNGTNWL